MPNLPAVCSMTHDGEIWRTLWIEAGARVILAGYWPLIDERPGPARGSGVRTGAPFVIGYPLLLLCALYSLQSTESFVVHDTQHADPCPHLMPAPPRRGLQLHLQLRSHAHLTFPEAPTCLRDNIALRWHATLLDS